MTSTIIILKFEASGPIKKAYTVTSYAKTIGDIRRAAPMLIGTSFHDLAVFDLKGNCIIDESAYLSDIGILPETHLIVRVYGENSSELDAIIQARKALHEAKNAEAAANEILQAAKRITVGLQKQKL